jgi:hypothetical protein
MYCLKLPIPALCGLTAAFVPYVQSNNDDDDDSHIGTISHNNMRLGGNPDPGSTVSVVNGREVSTSGAIPVGKQAHSSSTSTSLSQHT